MKRTDILYGILLAIIYTSCTTAGNAQLNKKEQIEKQLSTLKSLLQDSAFAASIAYKQDSAYYISQGKEAPGFSDTHETISKSFRDEKIATNLAGFYALECGIGVFVKQQGQTPFYWLNKIVNKQLDSAGILLLNRFANASWKAGQPFRDLSRIKRDNFIPASFLSAEETQKDYDQVFAAGSKLLDSLKDVSDQPAEIQFKKIDRLMKDKQYALEMAMHINSAYYLAQNKQVPLFLSAAENILMREKSIYKEKIATNIAGFYALECGLNYLVTAQHKLPTEILQSIIDGTISEEDKELLERFANLTWKAGQPFRDVERITRPVFTPFYFLPKEEIEKDWVQITTVAKQIIKMF